MVEAVVSFAVQKLGGLLIQEPNFLLGVRGRVELLHSQLGAMMCFLRDADEKQQQGNQQALYWVTQIRDVAYDAEDVMDNYFLKVTGSKGRRGINFGCSMSHTCYVKEVINLHKVGVDIQAILSRLQDISDNRIKYGIQDSGQGETPRSIANQTRQRQLRQSYAHVEDEDVIGLEEYMETLVAELIKHEERRCVISIVGVGGLGKTTLAKQAYKHGYVKSHFDFCAWTFISQQWSMKEVLKEILKEACVS